MSLFFIAPDAYSRSFSVANVNSFVSLNRMKITSFSSSFEKLIAAWQFASISSPAGVSLDTSNQDHGEKVICTTPDCAI